MNASFCVYDNNRDEALVAYLYDDITSGERETFERHLAACAVCRNELEALRGVRGDLARWSPPALTSVIAGARSGATSATRVHTWWWNVPAWAQVAAAILCLGVGAGLANLHITYDTAGLSVSTGWSAFADANAPATAGQVHNGDANATAAATRAELIALEQQLRAEMQASQTTLVAPAVAAARTADEEVVRKVRAMIRDSEQRQQRELALRLAQEARDRQAQRQADLVRIDRTLGVLQNNTGLAVRRQEQLLNSLAVRVSQRQ